MFIIFCTFISKFPTKLSIFVYLFQFSSIYLRMVSLGFFFFLTLFQLKANYNIVVVLAIHRHESAMGIHVSPYPEPPSPFRPYPIPLGCPRARSLSTLLHVSNLHWSSVLYMVIYTFQCYSLKSSHPRLLPQSQKVCSLYLCLFCCCYHLSKFQIYALIYYVGSSLSDLFHSV